MKANLYLALSASELRKFNGKLQIDVVNTACTLVEIYSEISKSLNKDDFLNSVSLVLDELYSFVKRPV